MPIFPNSFKGSGPVVAVLVGIPLLIDAFILGRSLISDGFGCGVESFVRNVEGNELDTEDGVIDRKAKVAEGWSIAVLLKGIRVSTDGMERVSHDVVSIEGWDNPSIVVEAELSVIVDAEPLVSKAGKSIVVMKSSV